jgi:hypothetical protein
MNMHEWKLRQLASENLAVMGVMAEFLHRFAKCDPYCAAMVRAGFDSAIEHLQIEAMRPTKALPRHDYVHAMHAADQLRQLTLGEGPSALLLSGQVKTPA